MAHSFLRVVFVDMVTIHAKESNKPLLLLEQALDCHCRHHELQHGPIVALGRCCRS